MSSRSPLRLTRRGMVVLVAAVALGVASYATGYGAFIVLTLIALVVVAMAIAIPRVASSVDFDRADSPRAVGRGQTVELTLAATARRPSPPIRVVDHLAGQPLPMSLPATSPEVQTVVRYRVQPLRRGIQTLGPLLEERTDPFGLATRTLTHQLGGEIIVFPVVHQLRPSVAGKVGLGHREIAPTRSADPAAEFRGMREYLPGDSDRLIHWPSSARSDAPLVRDLYETPQPTLTVLLETYDGAATDVLFEDSVEIAASLVSEALAREVAVTLRTRDRAVPGRAEPVRQTAEALELLARVSRTTAETTLPASAMVIGDPMAQVVLIAGAGSPLIGQLTSMASMAPRLVVLRLDDGAAPLGPLPVRHVDLTNAEQFTTLWNTAALAV